MALPDTVRAKLSSEAAGSISVSSVVVRDIPMRELVELMLGLTGKDVERIRELLLRGTLVSGASRFRWAGWEADPADLQALLTAFPDPQPQRPFAGAQCVRMVLRGPAAQIDIGREAGRKRRLFRRTSFWDNCMRLAENAALEYIEYSYRERADRYRMKLGPASGTEIRESARMLAYSSLESQIRGSVLETVDLLVER